MVALITPNIYQSTNGVTITNAWAKQTDTASQHNVIEHLSTASMNVFRGQAYGFKLKNEFFIVKNLNCMYRKTGQNLMQCKSPKTSQRPQKPPHGDQIIYRRYTKSKSVITKLLVSFRCQVKVLKGQVEETAWGYGCNRWWWQTCRGAAVESG